MKIIDLYVMVSKGEQPKKFKYRDEWWAYSVDDCDFRTLKQEYRDADIPTYEYLMSIIDTSNLNDEVEIIGEEKEDNFSGIRYFANGNCYMSIASEPPKTQDITIEKEIEKLNKKHFHKRQRQLANKINELIDEINKLNKN